MVFWHISSTLTDIIRRDRLRSPTGTPAKLATNLEEVQQFLYDYFRMHPDVIYHIPVEALKEDTVLVVRSETMIVGCIRYHWIGTYNNKRIHLVDCFCVHPTWRGKGVGDYLLHELHHMMKEKPCAMFLKEGSPLPIMPFYRGCYVYRTITKESTPNVQHVPTELAYKIMKIHQQVRPFLMIYRPSSNQIWRLYRSGIHYVLACIQDTYQTLHGKKMGWITGWIESPGITDAIRSDASYQLSTVSQFDMIWMHHHAIHSITMDRYVHHNKDISWKEDGPFYWYTYQWAPSIEIGPSYFVFV
jgi:GNAT superfamily N-acetyltransferase